MKHPQSAFSRLYQSTLRDYIAGKSRPDSQVIAKIGGSARRIALPLLEFAKLHENFLVMDLLPRCPVAKQAALIHKAGIFFAAAVAATNLNIHEAARLGEAIKSLSARTVKLAAANLQLGLEIIKRRDIETELRKSQQDTLDSLEKSEALKERLRGHSRQILHAQEDERKKISRELHDVIAQTLAGINVRLATLKTEAGINTGRLVRNISFTQKMVTKSADIVYQFARELRPAALDDLGLIPALHSFMRTFTERTGVRSHLTVFEGIEKLNAAKRTVLYRVAQEALTNVGRHAHASRVDVIIRREPKFLHMEVADDGKSFKVGQVQSGRETKHLGLLCMRERVEMIGGSFEIESNPGHGTKIIARIPITKATEKKLNEAPVANS